MFTFSGKGARVFFTFCFFFFKLKGEKGMGLIFSRFITLLLFGIFLLLFCTLEGGGGHDFIFFHFCYFFII
jgi:hypothetical protein